MALSSLLEHTPGVAGRRAALLAATTLLLLPWTPGCGSGQSGSTQLVPTVPSPSPRPVGEAFVVRAEFEGVDFTGAAVPDPYLAVGPSSIVLVVNWEIVIRDKTGGLVARATLDDFFDSAGRGNSGGFDARVYFDPTTMRFFVISTDVVPDPAATPCDSRACSASILLAVSRGADPSTLRPSDWQLYALDGALDGPLQTSNFAAEPVLGFNDDSLVIAVNMLRSSGAGIAFSHTKLRILDKRRVVAAEPVSWQDLLPGNGSSSFVPLAMSGGATLFLVDSGGAACGGSIWGLDDARTAARLSRVPGSGSCSGGNGKVPQPGGERPLDIFSSTIFQGGAFYRSGAVWVARAVGGNVGDRLEIRWAQVDVTGWPGSVRIAQESRIGAPSASVFHPAVAVDARGNALIAFVQAGQSEFPSIYFTGRLANDAMNTQRLSERLKPGAAALDAPDSNPLHGAQNRYGDYSGIALDPVDGSFWIHAEYAKSRNEWGTWVSNIAVR